MGRASKRRATMRKEENALWTIVGYLLSGLIFWGGLGWAADKWFGTSLLTLIGLLVGVSSSIYLIWLRYGRE